MNSSWQNPLRQAAEATFEELVLLVPLPEPGDEQLASPLATGMAVDFEGPLNGTLEVHVSEALLPVIAENMLGAFEPPSIGQQRDALGELANVLTGNLLPRLKGVEAIFHLRPPRPVKTPAGDADAVVVFGLDAGRAEIHLYATETADAALPVVA